MKQKFKWLLALVAMVASVNLMAETVTYSASSMSNKVWSISTSGTAPTGSSVSCTQTYGNTFGQATAGNSFTMTLSNFAADVTNLTFSLHANSKDGKGNISYSVDGGTEVFLVGTSLSSDVAFNTWGDNTSYGSDYRNVNFEVSISPKSSLVINVRCVSKNSIYFNGLTVTYSQNDPSGKDVSITADSELNLTSEESDGTISVTYGEDVDDKDINLYNDAECTTPFTGDWFTADFDASDNVEYMASANTGAAREAYIQIYVIADDAETDNTKVIKVTQAKYAAPTGTFEKFTGDLVEGDYVICSETTAMENTTTSAPRIGYQTISVSNNKIENPDEAVIWHIAASTTEGYWTIYNESAAKYAAFASTDGRGTLLENITDYALWQYSTVGSDKEFSNKGKASKYLRYNSTYGFASYATSTGTTLTLYKKQLAPTNEAVTFAAPTDGTLVIKNGATPIATGATIQDGTVLGVEFGMTPAEAYKDVAIKVTNTTTSADVTSTVYNSETQKITMPRYPITVAVTFTKLYKISLVKAGEGTGTATMNGVTTDIYVDGDTQIDLVASAVAPNEFTKWSATSNISIDAENDAETYAYAFGDGTITATFGVSALLPLDAPTLSAPTNITYNSVTLNWQELANAEGGYNVEILSNDETVAFDSGYGENHWTSDPILQANTTYTYTVQGIGDGSTYAEENNPKATSTFKTADYPAATLTLSENGETSELVGKLNTPITLPTESTQACDGKVFVGWSATEIDGETDVEPTLLDATYIFTDPEQLTKTIYAVYAKETAGETQKYTLDYTTDVSSKTLGYGSAVEVTASDGSEWVVKAFKQQGMQINTGKNASIKIPTCPQNITSIEVTGTAEKAVGLSAEDYSGSGTITYIAYGTDAKEQVIDLTNKSVNSGYIVGKSGANPITKIVVNYEGESSYSKYCTTCQAAVVPPTFSLTEESYTSAQTLELTAPEGDIYYTINDGTETKYTAAIALNNRGTYEISAYAKVDDRTSETVTKTYTLDWAYTLDELAASDVADGTSVQVTFENKEITNFYTNSQGKRYGIYVNVQKGGKDVEIYCNKAEHPNTWEVGGKVSSAQAISGTWTYYSGGSQWEFCPSNWDNISYTAPAKIESLVIDGDVTNKNYTAGQKLDFTGLTVTGVYSDNTDQNAHTEDVTDEISWTEVTLTQGQESATATATLNSVKTGNQDVKATKSITGLTVGAAKTLESIYVDNEHSTHKTAFFVGRPFSAEGLKVMARYNIGEDQPIALANLTIDNPTFSAAEAEHTINISYTENEVEKSTSYKVSVGYMNLSDLVAEDIPTNTSVKVAFSNVEITGFYTNKSDQRTGVYVNVKGKNNEYIELYSSGTPSETLNGWQEGGKLASKGNYITGTWKYYETNDVWEIDFGSSYAWSTNIEYTAPSIYPTGIAMSIPSATVKQSKSLDLDAIFTPANATVLNNLAWESDNAKVTVVPSQDKKSAKVTVASDATVGTATITVKVDDKDGTELSATCVITIQEYAVPRYGLYSGAISEGDYIFKADGQNYYMNNTNNNGRLANVANESNPEIVNNIITTDAETYVWQIAKSGDYWTIQNLENSKYVSSTAKSSAGLVDDATANTALWTITYDATNEVYTFVNLGRSQAASDADKCYLRNNNNNGWACYASGTGNAITLYKAGFTPAAALQSIEIKGDLEITEYFQGKSVKYDGLTVEGTYSDGDKKTITEGIVWSASPASFSDLGAQTVTITATVTTKSGEVTDDAEFNVTVVESQQVNYGLVTNVATLYDGATIILGAVFGTDATPIYAVNQGFESKYLKAYRSNDPNGSDLEYENEVMKTAYASEITLKKVEGGWKLLGEDGKYINGAGDLSQTTDVAEATVWTISIEDGVAKIASGSNIIYYNTSSPRFKTYTSAQQEIGIYMKEVERETLRENLENGKMYSYCPAYDLALVEGAIFYQPDYMDAAYVHFVEVTEIKAGYGYILEGKGEALKAVQVGEEVTTAVAADADNTRGMQGVLKGNANYDINGENEGYQFPATSYSQALVSNNHLQYVGKDNVIIVGRAYLDLDIIADLTAKDEIQYPGLRRVAINFGGQAPTNLNGLNGNMKAAKVLRDGQLYIIREAKTYNAQGIEVQ